MRLVLVVLAVALLASACATKITGGPRPPQGSGPAGTQFGFWDRDAEGAVDAGFRTYVNRTYDGADFEKARPVLEKDGFTCRDGNRPEARPVPQLECERLYQQGENVHAWSVEFWSNQKEPVAHYSRTYLRDPAKVYDDRKNK